MGRVLSGDSFLTALAQSNGNNAFGSEARRNTVSCTHPCYKPQNSSDIQVLRDLATVLTAASAELDGLADTLIEKENRLSQTQQFMVYTGTKAIEKHVSEVEARVTSKLLADAGET